jgi:hypothetical protein
MDLIMVLAVVLSVVLAWDLRGGCLDFNCFLGLFLAADSFLDLGLGLDLDGVDSFYGDSSYDTLSGSSGSSDTESIKSSDSEESDDFLTSILGGCSSSSSSSSYSLALISL